MMESHTVGKGKNDLLLCLDSCDNCARLQMKK